MSRMGPSRSGPFVCGDCNASDPPWASLTRGILVCTECASIHRTLGRHFSRLKYLKGNQISGYQVNMVCSLHSEGTANALWEFALQDSSRLSLPRGSSATRKPSPYSPLKTKMEFIRKKHEENLFTFKPESMHERPTAEDLSQQLHANVRTGNLETSLRLLIMGADPNYYHPEKLTCPVHVAAKSSQGEQIELLAAYGADVAAVDGQEGKIAAQMARDMGDTKLGLRLDEIQYEVTDHLALYVCGKRPDHGRGQHFLVPSHPAALALSPEIAKVARQRLLSLSDAQLDNTTQDLYDEADRREQEELMNRLGASVRDVAFVPALPWYPKYSQARNDNRQKLATLSQANFSLLIIDCLAEKLRRSEGGSPGALNNNLQRHGTNNNGTGSISIKDGTWGTITQRAQLSTLTPVGDDGENDYDEPLYDSVASEDDYAVVDRDKKFVMNMRQPAYSMANGNGPVFSEAERQKMVALEGRLEQTQVVIKELEKNKMEMSGQISVLQNMVHQLMQENNNLRVRRGGSAEPAVGEERYTASAARNVWQTSPSSLPSAHHGHPQQQQQQQFSDQPSHHSFPQQPNFRANQVLSSASIDEGGKQSSGFLSGQFLPSEVASRQSGGGVQRSNSLHFHQQRPNTMFETGSVPAGGATGTLATIVQARKDSAPEVHVAPETLPSPEDIQRGIRPVTLGIHELKSFIESRCENKRRSEDDPEMFKRTVEKVREAVMNFMTIFPKSPTEGPMKEAMRQLVTATTKLTDLSDNWGSDGKAGAVARAPLQFDVANLGNSVFSYAFEVAKATREVATIAEQLRAKHEPRDS